MTGQDSRSTKTTLTGDSLTDSFRFPLTGLSSPSLSRPASSLMSMLFLDSWNRWRSSSRLVAVTQVLSGLSLVTRGNLMQETNIYNKHFQLL